MKDRSLWRAFQETPWAITEEKFGDLFEVLMARLEGRTLTPEQIQAIVSGAMQERAARLEAAATITRNSAGLVAVVPLIGTIFYRSASLEESSGGTSIPEFQKAFRAAVNNKDVRTVLLDVESPGGTVTGVDEMAQEIFQARDQKRIVAMADATMASAAYYLASQAHEVVSIPSGRVGSIGVFAAHQDLSKRADLLGVKMTFMSAGKYKLEGNPFEPLSAEAKDRIQGLVDDAYSNFVDAVAQGRGVRPSAVKNGFGEGRVLTATEAKAAGLIDRIATRDETIGRLLGRTPKAESAAVDQPAVMADDRRRRLALQ